MKDDPIRSVEAAIDRELKSLPTLKAPDTLIPRVMAGIQKASAIPWFRQPWPMWSATAKVVSLGLFLLAFGGMCVGGGELFHSEEVANAGRGIREWLAQLGVTWGAVRVLLEALVLAAKQLGTGFVVACFMIAGFGYVAFVGLGTLVARFALARR